MCLVLDLGGPQAAAIARKVRTLDIYSEVLPFDAGLEKIVKRAPKALIVAGGEGNPFREDAPVLRDGIYGLGLPVLGLGFGAGVLLRRAGGMPIRSMPGRQTVEVAFSQSALFDGVSDSERYVERLDEIGLPEGYRSIAQMGDWSVAFEDTQDKIWGVQFYPEQNDPDGLKILINFLVDICGCERDWTTQRFVEEEPERIRQKVGERQVVMAISGGVDSAACAALMHRAIGDQLKCVYVDTGFMRKGDNDLARYAFEKLNLGVNRIDARERFLERIKGVTESSAKRKLVEDELTRVFEEFAGSIEGEKCLARGTTYDDLLFSLREPDAPDVPGTLFSVLVEPIKRLFKDEVRALGEALGLGEELTRRQAFPDAGLALRCLGEVTADKLRMLRDADRIFREEIIASGLDRKIRQYFAVLTDLTAKGARAKTGYTLALRAASWTGASSSATAYRLPYDLLERVVERVTGEVEGIVRVVYDITGKPPAEIEW